MPVSPTDPLTWTDVVPWAISLASAAVATVSLWTARRANAKAEQAKRTELASKFGVWIDRTPDDEGKARFRLMCNNGNPVPVVHVVVTVLVPGRAKVYCHLGDLPPTSEPQVDPVGTRRLDKHLMPSETGEEAARKWIEDRYAAILWSVEFTDPAGMHWRRDLDGNLAAIPRRSLSERIEEMRDMYALLDAVPKSPGRRIPFVRPDKQRLREAEERLAREIGPDAVEFEEPDDEVKR